MNGDPASYEEYIKRYYANQRMTSYGLDTTCHVPCPFCAAPDFMVYRIIDVEETINKGATCKECGRSCAMPVTITDDGLGKSFEMVQTAGPDQPDWMTPKMRRAM